MTIRTPSWTNDRVSDQSKLQYLKQLVAQHIDSFNYFLGDGMRFIERGMVKHEIELRATKDQHRIIMWFEDLKVLPPMHGNSASTMKDTRMFPSECKEARTSYGGNLEATICVQIDSETVHRFKKVMGSVPIMIGSEKCHLNGASAATMVRRHEDATELGGYFICNGNERMIRMLQIPRRNHMMALERAAYRKRGPLFTTKAITMRCVGPDMVGKDLVLHYLHDGTASVRVLIRKSEYFIPVMLLMKALKGPMVTDKEIYTSVLRGAHLDGDTFISDRVELSLRQLSNLRIFTAAQCRQYLGAQFRSLIPEIPSRATDEEAGTFFLNRYVFVHLNSCSLDGDVNVQTDAEIGHEKFNLLIEMLRKLYAFVSNRIGVDNPDALNSHEILLGGHLIGMILKERLENFLFGVGLSIQKEMRTAKDKSATLSAILNTDLKLLKKLVDRQGDACKKLWYFLATGNLVSESGLALMQVSGYTIVAEKLNRYRYLSHFRAVHRGAFFTEMKTTAVRKLLPESYGFLCPVHTPDGSPCGLLNHLANGCAITTHNPKGGNILAGIASGIKKRSKQISSSGSTRVSLSPSMVSSTSSGTVLGPAAELLKNLIAWGIMPAGPGSADIIAPYNYLPVCVDGRVVGHASEELLINIVVPRLRRAKALSLKINAVELTQQHVPVVETARLLRDYIASDMHRYVTATMEVCFIPVTVSGGAFPGLFIFTDAARMIRPVVHLETGFVELIGVMEQTYLEIAVRPEEVRIGVDTHCELWPSSMLSEIASLTPFSDFNQSPRNMYQCQMGKQTMGTPAHNLKYRTDNKLYRIQTPQAPVVQNGTQGLYSMDEYPNGTNAIVAVISYTGYDMEDAMILNKSSYERGFAHASMYKTKVIDLTQEVALSKTYVFGNTYPKNLRKGDQLVTPALDTDGLPHIGQLVQNGDPIACAVDEETGQVKIFKHKDAEEAYIDKVCLIDTGSTQGVKKITITFRYNRNPVVGDKFSSRHGQKGVMSILWPQADMPFTESGMTPDVIINPHAFPSRMTIGMLIESMAGKAGALHGAFQDGTPFTLQGDTPGQTAVDYFGEQLRAAGYNYYGSEPLYSGLQGTELRADIFIGVVYYQRLRHMVSDKSQVRSLGPIDQITRQPVKGRKHHGGVRFGEMERDSLLAHGTSFLMRDRLLTSSDKHTAFVCCGSILAIHNKVDEYFKSDGEQGQNANNVKLVCRLCGESNRWKAIVIPYVFRYLCNELAAMGMKLSIE